MSSGKKVDRTPTEKEIIAKFNSLRQELRQIDAKISELDMDRNEHELVLDAIKDKDPQRRCFRLVGGVLVERTVQDVMPAVEEHRNNINNILAKLAEKRTEKAGDIEKFKKAFNIQVREGGIMGGGPTEEAEETKIETKATGVLV